MADVPRRPLQRGRFEITSSRVDICSLVQQVTARTELEEQAQDPRQVSSTTVRPSARRGDGEGLGCGRAERGLSAYLSVDAAKRGSKAKSQYKGSKGEQDSNATDLAQCRGVTF